MDGGTIGIMMTRDQSRRLLNLALKHVTDEIRAGLTPSVNRQYLRRHKYHSNNHFQHLQLPTSTTVTRASA